jgi:hypothetical protein
VFINSNKNTIATYARPIISIPYEHISLTKMAADPPSCKVILAKNIASGLLEEVRTGLMLCDKKPHLVGFLANSDPAAKMYADWTEKTCEEK